MLRVGCVKYLNARPLIRGWSGEVDFDHPSALCKRLANGELDAALVSSFEFLRNPIYRIVDDVSISSDGPVYSVVVAHHGNISEVKEIQLDPASQTAVNLLRCLLAELGLNPRLIERSTGFLPVGRVGVPRASIKLDCAYAQLLIGDQAIRFRQEHSGDFHFWDLGEQWKNLIGLSFVYALWLVRPEVTDAETVAGRLRTLRDENLVHLDRLIAAETEFDHQFCTRYYSEQLRFNLGEKEKKGLRTFADLCAKHGVLEKRDLALDVV
jgi:predicted solute-binding protein